MFAKTPTCDHAPTITVLSAVQDEDFPEFSLIVESDDYLPLPPGWLYSLERDHAAFRDQFPAVARAVVTSTFRVHADNSLYHVDTVVSSSSAGVEPASFPRPGSTEAI